MTPDVVFTFCDGTNVTYKGMAGVNTLVRTVWLSPPPDAPWAANQAEDFQPPGDSGMYDKQYDHRTGVELRLRHRGESGAGGCGSS